MALIDESAVASSNLAGLRVLSEDQTVQFTLYLRHVLPLDGYVFWLGTGKALPVRGSFHVSADKLQREDETIAINRVVMTTGEEVQGFNAIGPDQLWVGEIAGVRFAFSRSGPRFKVAGLYHYNGEALYPALGNILVPLGSQLPDTTLVVSNSLPLWLALRTYTPVWLLPPNPLITLYPSFAIPDNLAPPYGSVHIEPDGTHAVQPTPHLGPTRPVGNAAYGIPFGTTPDSTHWQLVADRVRITLYGTTNQQAMDFLDLVNRYSFDQDTMGIMRCESAARDDKRTQSELGILAMKKTITYEVSYYQSRVDTIARQLVEHASATVSVSPYLN